MTRRIFYSIVSVALAVMLASAAIILWVLYGYFQSQFLQELRNEAQYIAQGVEIEGQAYLNSLAPSATRITWIDASGRVLYDNQADAAGMENHLDREEVQEALTSSSGVSERYSDTLSEKTIYYAQRLQDGTVLRLATTQRSILVLLLGMLRPILITVLAVLAVSGLLAHRLARRIVEPINALDLEHPFGGTTYEELSPLLRRLEHQNRQIQEQLEELGRQQEEFSSLIDHMSEGILILDQEAKLLSCNKAAMQLLNIPEDALHKNVLFLNRSEEFRHAADSSLEGRHSEQTIAFGDRIYHLLANPVWQDGRVSGAVLILLDVTEKESREALRREFTANVSHELKTPLTAISGTAEAIEHGLIQPTDIPHFADNIYQESQRLIRLVEDIIRLSRLEESDFSGQMQPVDLAGLVRATAERFVPIAQKSGIQIQVETVPCTLEGIPSILEEIIYNLCDNAVKYNRENGAVRVSLQRREGQILLAVQDTGIGIPADQQERIFERFYRVDKSHSKEVGGTGLGLSIVKHGVACHGGKIRLESEPGHGTLIEIQFADPGGSSQA